MGSVVILAEPVRGLELISVYLVIFTIICQELSVYLVMIPVWNVQGLLNMSVILLLNINVETGITHTTVFRKEIYVKYVNILVKPALLIYIAILVGMTLIIEIRPLIAIVKTNFPIINSDVTFVHLLVEPVFPLLL